MTQDEFLDILFIDCGFTPAQKRDFLGLRFSGRRYADELSVAEKSRLIDDLMERKVAPLKEEPDEDSDADLTAKQRAKRVRP
jgi:hypothetical protein